MVGGIDANVLLDYIEFWIYPSQNRYEASICYQNMIETVTSGVLEPLAMHSPKIKALFSKGSDGTFKLQPPENLNDAKWFTRSVLTRFVHLIGSSDVLDKAKAMENEISQLEESRKFHASIYAKADDNSVTPDASKNELLRAMELRLTALRDELDNAWCQAALSACSSEEITDIQKFCHHFGAVDLRNSLQKFLELSQENRSVNFTDVKYSLTETDSGNASAGSEEGNSQISKAPHSNTPVIYGASPAIAAQIEMQSSSGEESSCISEEDQPAVERSRPLMRSASPRRSASPIRRIQIRCSGTRRSTALTIKSLNHFPAREKLVSQKNESESSDEEESKETSKVSENNVCRISVQAAISLFEGKQKDQSADIQKTKSLLNVPVITANKAVLRRWSAGMSENSKSPADAASDNSPSMTNNLEGHEILSTSELKSGSDSSTSGFPLEAAEIEAKPDVCEEIVSVLEEMQDYSLPVQREEGSEIFAASAERSCQKEEEPNLPQINMMKTKPERFRSTALNDGKDKSFPNERRVHPSNHHYKEKRNEKLQCETDSKRLERENSRSTLNERIAEMTSGNSSTVAKRHTVKKTQSTLKNSPQCTNPKDETSKPSVVKKVSNAKASPLPAMRKSWPSTPLPRATGASRVETPTQAATAAATPTSRRPKSTPSVPRSSQKFERSQPEPTSVKTSPSDARKSVKNSIRKQQQEVIGASKPTKTKVQVNEVTKKSSMVPLELNEPAKKLKPLLCKDLRTRPGVSPVIKTKSSSPPVEPLMDSVDSERAKENEKAPIVSEQVHQQEDTGLPDVKVHAELETETQLKSPQKCEDIGSSNPATSKNEVDFQNKHMSVVQNESEDESNISPAAWTEIEEHKDEQIPCKNAASHTESIATEAKIVTIPQVHHSFSQPLQDESSEPGVVGSGNAENPPTMVLQKDVPRGLKFALSKKGGDNLLKKATLHAKNYGNKKALSSESCDKDSTAVGFLLKQLKAN